MGKKYVDKKPRLTPASREAKLAVAQVYWNNDQEYKRAESRRASARDLALVAVRLGETAGPVTDDDGRPHWLTHGEKERVEMSAVALSTMMVGIADYCTVNAAKLKADHPKIYERMLKHTSTKRTKHDCLTWSDSHPAPRARGKRP